MRIIQELILFLLVIVFFLAGKSYSQSVFNADSLENELISIEDNLVKVEILTSLAKGYYYEYDNEKSEEYTNQLLEFADSIRYYPGIIDANSIKGVLCKRSYSYDSALIYINNAIRLADSMGDKKRLAKNYVHKAHLTYFLGDPKSAKEEYYLSCRIFEDIADSTGQMDALNGLGVMYKKLGMYDSAIYYFSLQIRICEEAGNDQKLAKGLTNLAIVYSDIDENESAIPHLKKSIQLFLKYNEWRSAAVAYNNLGIIAYEDHDMELALTYYDTAAEFAMKAGDMAMEADLALNIGSLYLEKQQLDLAMVYYLRAKMLYEQIDDSEGLALAYKNTGVIYERWKDFEKAIQYYDSCEIIAKELNDLKTLSQVYYNKYAAYYYKRDNENALEYLYMHLKAKDSLFYIERAQYIADIQLNEVRFEKERVQAENLKLERDFLEQDLILQRRTSQRNIYLFTGLGIVAITMFLFLYYRQKTVKDRIIAEQKIRQLEEEKKLLSAKALVEGQEEERKRVARELHDGLGVLLSTAKMAFTTFKDPKPENIPLIEKATKLLEQASGDVRKISHNMMPGLLTKLGLFEAVEDLMEKISETEELSVHTDIPEDVDRLPENKEIMIYRIVQELINNTLKHAGAKNIELSIQLMSEELQLRYADDGKGFVVEEKLESKSIGLSSIQSRVDFLNGKMEVSSQPGQGTSYLIKVPFQ